MRQHFKLCFTDNYIQNHECLLLLQRLVICQIKYHYVTFQELLRVRLCAIFSGKKKKKIYQYARFDIYIYIYRRKGKMHLKF